MRPLLLGLALMLPASAWAQPPDAFDTPGFDRHDRTPDWNYRLGETDGPGAYYDGGRYGPRGLLGEEARLDPWLAEARVAARDPAKANRGFRKWADRNRDKRLTDAEIPLVVRGLER